MGNIKMNIKTSIFNLQYLNRHGFLCKHEQNRCKKDLSNDICYIFVSYIVSEILVKNWKLLTLIIHGTEAPLYTKKYICSPYFLLYTCQILHVVNNNLKLIFICYHK